MQGQFFHTTNVANSWWRVDFGVSRRIQRVQIQNRQDSNTFSRIVGAQIMIGDFTTVSLNLQCGSALSGSSANYVTTCDQAGRYLYVFMPRVSMLHFSEHEAFGPCACPAGNYGPSVGSGPCVACPANTYKSLTDLVCQLCPLDSVSLEGSTSIASCTCQADFVKVPVSGQCIPFELRTVASSPTGFAGTRILNCQPGQTSPAGCTSLADCVCAPVFSLVAGACEPCAADSYKATAGDAACASCDANERSLSGSTAKDECLCDAGFTGTGCTACAQHTYKTHVGNASCVACPGNTSQALGISGAIKQVACQCNPGFYGPDGGPCQACHANYHKPAAGPHACLYIYVYIHIYI